MLLRFSCDQGGDCECICNVLADFAAECSTQIGELHNWRAPADCRKTSAYPAYCIVACYSYFAIVWTTLLLPVYCHLACYLEQSYSDILAHHITFANSFYCLIGWLTSQCSTSIANRAHMHEMQCKKCIEDQHYIKCKTSITWNARPALRAMQG